MLSEGNGLRALRYRVGITQAQLARRIHMKQKTISMWERNIRKPDSGQVRQLAIALGVEPFQIRSALARIPKVFPPKPT